MDLSPRLLTAWSELDQAGAQQASECFSFSLTDAYEAQCLTSLITVPAVVTAATCLPGPSPDLREVNKTVSFRLATCPESKVSFSPYVWPAIIGRRSQWLSFRRISDHLQDKDKTTSPIYKYIYIHASSIYFQLLNWLVFYMTFVPLNRNMFLAVWSSSLKGIIIFKTNGT